MAESIVEECTELVSNRFKLVLLASQRTHDLNTGASNPVRTVQFKDHKNTIVSLHEIAEKQVDTHELFNLLVGRCKEYMKGNMNNVYSSDTSKIANLLNFSDNTDLDASRESQDYEVDDKINDQDGDEEVSV
jgi:DNA-directed RNA polymerase subunit omega